MTWMKHAESGGLADLPDLPYWRAIGWEPTEERPAEPDLLRDPVPQADDPAEETTKTPSKAGSSAAKGKKSAASSASTEEAESDR